VKIAIDALREYVALPDEGLLRDLFDDTGLEVKREERGPQGLVFTLELLANRGDHHGYAGVARELVGRLGGGVTLPRVVELHRGVSPVPVRLESPLCLVYTATLLVRSGGEVGLDPRVTRPLLAAGLHPVTAAVDATNLANLELGQPTHAFDADAIVGGITVRAARAGETAWPLFQAGHVPVPEGTLVIADDVKILAIAGVIGCEDSKTTAATTRLLLESATFDPVAVRKASRALAIHTDSSARFERGGDPSLPLIGAGRVVQLLESVGWKRAGATGVAGDWSDPKRVITLDVAAAARFLDAPLAVDEAAERLARYDFEIRRDGSRLQVGVPPHRLWDVETAADLYEELAKSIGYNATPIALPAVQMGSLPTASEAAKATVDEVLVGLGFYEVFTDASYGRDARERLGVVEGHPLWPHVEILNAVDRGYSLLRNNCVVAAAETVATNLRVQRREIRAWEWTRTFHPKAEADNGVCVEHRVLWLVANGPVRTPTWAEDPPDADVHYAKGLIAELGAALGIALTVEPSDPAMPLSALLHPNRQAFIVAKRAGARAVVGIVGELHPRVLAGWKIKRERPIYVEISASALLGAVPPPASYTEAGDRQPVVRDLAFTLPDRVTAGEVIDALREAGPAFLARVAATDLFAHEDGGKPVRTVTFALTFDQEARALTADEVNAASEGLIQAVTGKLGDRGVKLRG
jgi:phenylalanyl-tRNA synthetase beta chain